MGWVPVAEGVAGTQRRGPGVRWRMGPDADPPGEKKAGPGHLVLSDACQLPESVQ